MQHAPGAYDWQLRRASDEQFAAMASNVRHIDLPLQVAGLVVGKKGVKINQIKQRSRAQVELAKDTLPSDENLKRLTMKGSDEELHKAEEMVYDLLSKWCVGEGSEGNFALLPVEVQRKIKEMPAPIADGDESTPQLEQQHPQHLHQQPQGTEDLLLQQQQQQQQLLQQQLQMQALQQQMLQQQVEPVTVAVPSDCFRVLARDSGSQIASIESMSKAKISYARWKQAPDSSETWLAIYGEPDNVRNARDMLIQIVDHLKQRLRPQAQQQPASADVSLPIGALQGSLPGASTMENMMGALGVAGDAQALGGVGGGGAQFGGGLMGGVLPQQAGLAMPQMMTQAFSNPQMPAASALGLAGGLTHMAQGGGDNMQQQQHLHQQQRQAQSITSSKSRGVDMPPRSCARHEILRCLEQGLSTRDTHVAMQGHTADGRPGVSLRTIQRVFKKTVHDNMAKHGIAAPAARRRRAPTFIRPGVMRSAHGSRHRRMTTPATSSWGGSMATFLTASCPSVRCLAG